MGHNRGYNGTKNHWGTIGGLMGPKNNEGTIGGTTGQKNNRGTIGPWGIKWDDPLRGAVRRPTLILNLRSSDRIYQINLLCRISGHVHQTFITTFKIQ